MGHCISVYLAKESDLEFHSYQGKDFVRLKSGIVAFEQIPESLKNELMYAYVSTDYFGGAGEQEAILFCGVLEDGRPKIFFERDSYQNGEPINEVLRLLGVTANNGQDEFDTVGLGNYRSNESFGFLGNYQSDEQEPKMPLLDIKEQPKKKQNVYNVSWNIMGQTGSEEIYADQLDIHDGAYIFYEFLDNNQKKIVKCLPIMFTIINSVSSI